MQPPHKSRVRIAAALATVCAACVAACAGQATGSPANAPVPDAAERIEDLRVLNGAEGVVRAEGVRLVGVRAPAFEVHVRAPVATAYAALTDAYRVAGFPATRFDTTTHIVGAVDVRAADRIDVPTLRRYVSCGGGSYAEPSLGEYRVMVTLLSRVTPDGAGSLVSTQLFAAGQRPGAAGPRTVCPTTGRLEAIVNRAVKAVADPRAPTP